MKKTIKKALTLALVLCMTLSVLTVPKAFAGSYNAQFSRTFLGTDTSIDDWDSLRREGSTSVYSAWGIPTTTDGYTSANSNGNAIYTGRQFGDDFEYSLTAKKSSAGGTAVLNFYFNAAYTKSSTAITINSGYIARIGGESAAPTTLKLIKVTNSSETVLSTANFVDSSQTNGLVAANTNISVEISYVNGAISVSAATSAVNAMITYNDSSYSQGYIGFGNSVKSTGYFRNVVVDYIDNSVDFAASSNSKTAFDNEDVVVGITFNSAVSQSVLAAALTLTNPSDPVAAIPRVVVASDGLSATVTYTTLTPGAYTLTLPITFQDTAGNALVEAFIFNFTLVSIKINTVFSESFLGIDTIPSNWISSYRASTGGTVTYTNPWNTFSSSYGISANAATGYAVYIGRKFGGKLDYSLTARRTKSSNQTRICFNADYLSNEFGIAIQNGYMVKIYDDGLVTKVELVKVINGDNTTNVLDSVDFGALLAAAADFDVEISFDDGVISVSAVGKDSTNNRSVTLSYTDPTPVTNGFIGFGTATGSANYFKNVSIEYPRSTVAFAASTDSEQVLVGSSAEIVVGFTSPVTQAAVEAATTLTKDGAVVSADSSVLLAEDGLSAIITYTNLAEGLYSFRLEGLEDVYYTLLESPFVFDFSYYMSKIYITGFTASAVGSVVNYSMSYENLYVEPTTPWVVIAAYTDENELIGVSSPTVTPDVISASLPVGIPADKTVHHVTAFMWDSSTNLSPYCQSNTLLITQ